MSNDPRGTPVDPERVIKRLANKNADLITQVTILEAALEMKDEEIAMLKRSQGMVRDEE